MGQLLITALVASGVLLWWRSQRTSNQNSTQKPAPSFKIFVVGLLATALIASGGYALYDWRDKHTLLEVTLVNPATQSREIYKVYKKNLQENAFTTVDGQRVRIASSERLEVRRLSN